MPHDPAPDPISRFRIDPRHYRADRFRYGCLAILGLLLLAFLVGTLKSGFWAGSLFAVLMIALIAWILLGERRRIQEFEITERGLVFLPGLGFFGERLFLTRGEGVDLSLEFVESASDTGSESHSTLNLWHGKTGNRYPLALGVDEDERRVLLHQLVDFLSKNSFPVRWRDELEGTSGSWPPDGGGPDSDDHPH